MMSLAIFITHHAISVATMTYPDGMVLAYWSTCVISMKKIESGDFQDQQCKFTFFQPYWVLPAPYLCSFLMIIALLNVSDNARKHKESCNDLWTYIERKRRRKKQTRGCF
ncbi:uncharacterized protein BYT42DRAFT_573823 [Radiomyces spectabilis]|uniref:uncharacterized protein n=1 Tax=Radiomyces spectabilis TaxID=64574 RepID=UPI0022211F48|nr:uncharacterized protein BYT42DRAFT_573823 [Radiomyces spectabilis]KAI8376220.1 hypothetical protein BYT42DRAFT_573823 [Radiomyces spectabilis]